MWAASAALVTLSLAAGSIQAQGPGGDLLTNAGVARVSAVVDSVFIDQTLGASEVRGGDFASYLMARLGVTPLPPDLRLRVSVDTQQIMFHGEIQDLPVEAREALGPLFLLFGPETPIAAYVELLEVGSRRVRFRLASIRINDVGVPERLLATVMSHVGSQYPALTPSGRDLLVEIPPTARIVLAENAVRLVGPQRAGSGQH